MLVWPFLEQSLITPFVFSISSRWDTVCQRKSCFVCVMYNFFGLSLLLKKRKWTHWVKHLHGLWYSTTRFVLQYSDIVKLRNLSRKSSAYKYHVVHACHDVLMECVMWLQCKQMRFRSSNAARRDLCRHSGQLFHYNLLQIACLLRSPLLCLLSGAQHARMWSSWWRPRICVLCRYVWQSFTKRSRGLRSGYIFDRNALSHCNQNSSSLRFVLIWIKKCYLDLKPTIEGNIDRGDSGWKHNFSVRAVHG